MNIVKISKVLDKEDETIGTGIEIFFSSGESKKIDAKKLRGSCPCASCLESRGDISHSTPLTAPNPIPKGRSLLNIVENKNTIDERIKKIWSIGNYAIGVLYLDGHDSGIYTYKYLIEI